MDAYTFFKTTDKATVEAVAVRAGTSFDYFKQLAYGHRRPSVKLAEKLVTASSNKLDFVRLLKGPERKAQEAQQ